MKILNICRRSSREPAPAPSSLSWAGPGLVEFVIIILSEPPSSELKPESKKGETKNGRIESTSTMLRESIRKAHFCGAPANLSIVYLLMLSKVHISCCQCLCNLRKYSSVNQAMQMVSISDSQGCSMVSPAMLVTCHHHHYFTINIIIMILQPGELAAC